ncbi:MAG: single-stranded DNA-binding protein [Streptosporangiaceae bacterium]
MNDALITVVGNVASEPRHAVTRSGVHVTNLRVASTARRFDRAQGQWCDASTLYITVSCWRQLAQNVAASVHKGDPLVVAGRLRTRSYTDRDAQRRVYTEIEASAVGHDLTRGVGQFVKGRPVAGKPEGAEAMPVPEGDDVRSTSGVPAEDAGHMSRLRGEGPEEAAA